VAAMLLLTLRGTPFMYYGEEIGMKNSRIPRAKIADPAGKKYWPFYIGRDCCRTPMQWSSQTNAGFTQGNIWLPVSMDYKKVNVENQTDDKYSLLNFYKRLIKLRKEKASLSHGTWKVIAKGNTGIFTYLREHEKQILCVLLNFTKKQQTLNAGHRGQWKVLFSTHRSVYEHFAHLHVRLYPFEATIIEKIGDLAQF